MWREKRWFQPTKKLLDNSVANIKSSEKSSATNLHKVTRFWKVTKSDKMPFETLEFPKLISIRNARFWPRSGIAVGRDAIKYFRLKTWCGIEGHWHII